MKHRFFKQDGVEMVEINVGDPNNLVCRPATKEDHEAAKHDDPDPMVPPKEAAKETPPAKKPPYGKTAHDEDD
jgi:hypothetical protein